MTLFLFLYVIPAIICLIYVKFDKLRSLEAGHLPDEVAVFVVLMPVVNLLFSLALTILGIFALLSFLILWVPSSKEKK